MFCFFFLFFLTTAMTSSFYCTYFSLSPRQIMPTCWSHKNIYIYAIYLYLITAIYCVCARHALNVTVTNRDPAGSSIKERHTFAALCLRIYEASLDQKEESSR
uniref:Secreted protein n=1 Tax=Rhipicephalus microplus TaxID=6941 RepID=A0A6M2DAG5_RHIMP